MTQAINEMVESEKEIDILNEWLSLAAIVTSVEEFQEKINVKELI